jgi:hypothetical protein
MAQPELTAVLDYCKGLGRYAVLLQADVLEQAIREAEQLPPDPPHTEAVLTLLRATLAYRLELQSLAS